MRQLLEKVKGGGQFVKNDKVKGGNKERKKEMGWRSIRKACG